MVDPTNILWGIVSKLHNIERRAAIHQHYELAVPGALRQWVCPKSARIQVLAQSRQRLITRYASVSLLAGSGLRIHASLFAQQL